MPKLEMINNREGIIAKIVRGAVNRKKFVYLAVAALVALGIFGLKKMNKDEFPTFQLKQGLVAAVYPGASPEDVEEQLAKPLENVLMGFGEVVRGSLQSYSREGMCYIYVDLNCPQSRKDEVWSKIKLKLESAKATSLPAGVAAVVVLDDFSAVSALLIALESDDKSPTELQTYADELSDRLRRIDMLASVSVSGTREEEIAVILDFDKISTYGIDPSALLLEYQTASLNIPSGELLVGNTKEKVHVLKDVTSEKEIGDKVVWSDPSGSMVRLRDIARVERRYKEAPSKNSYNGNNALILSVVMRPDNNIVAFGEEVDKVLAEYEKQLPPSVHMSRITDQPKVVGKSVWSFLRDLLISMLVVILVMLMLFPMRSALIASSGVPVCTAVALAVMYIAKIDMNTVTLAALIVVLGMIVDDSIITMDGYMDKLGKGLNKVDAAVASANELLMPMFMATFAISAMFFPVPAILTGYLGDFVEMFPWVIAIALAASLFYAVLVVPSLEVKFINGHSSEKQNVIQRIQNRFFDALQRVYDRAQAVCFKHPGMTILTGVAAVALGVFMFTRLNIQMMPMAARSSFAIEIYMEPSTSLSRTSEVADSLSVLLRQDDRILSVTNFEGSGSPRFHTTYSPKLPGPGFAQLIVNTSSEKATEALIADLEPWVEHYFSDALIRIKQMDYQGVTSQIAVDLVGGTPEQLYAVADRIEDFMRGMSDGLKWVHKDCGGIEPTVNVRIREDDAARLGVNRAALSLEIFSALGSGNIAGIQEDGKTIPVNLYCSSFENGADYNDLLNHVVGTSVPGVSVPLRQVADIEPGWQYESLGRKGGENAVSVMADLKAGHSHPAEMKKIEAFIENEIRPNLPEGMELRYAGLSSTNGQVGPEIVMAFIVAVLILFSFLVFTFRKVSIAILTLVLSMLCLFGASFGLWVFDQDFGITCVLGLVSLVGIIVRNGMIMFEYAEQLRFEKGYDIKSAAEEAGKRRMRPIFLTSCTTALGVLPMILAGDSLWMPLGLVICFGTILSIALIVLIMPVSYWQIFKGNEKK